MWIELKADGLVGPARIGRVLPGRGRTLRYGDQKFQSLRGNGFKANYRDSATLEEYWISGCHKDGKDALYSTTVEIDEDVREEYWLTIRGRPDLVHLTSFRAEGKTAASAARSASASDEFEASGGPIRTRPLADLKRKRRAAGDPAGRQSV